MAINYKSIDPSAYTPATYEYLKKKYPDPEEDAANNYLIDGSDLADYYTNQRNRIPQGNELENQSSDVISGLLNPPEFFPETDRRSAELGTSRGISGSPAEFSAGVRMTDEERLKRMALGQGFLTAAYGRNPAVGPEYQFNTPYQDQQLKLEKERLDLQKKSVELENELKRLQIRNLKTPSVQFTQGGSVGGGRYSTSGSTPQLPDFGGYQTPENYSGTAPVGGGFQNTGDVRWDDLLGDYV